jgi:hypothetical protein
MLVSPEMTAAAMTVAKQHGLVSATGMSDQQYGAVLATLLQSALDADPFLTRCRIVRIGSDPTQLAKLADIDNPEEVLANCNVKIFMPATCAGAAGA